MKNTVMSCNSYIKTSANSTGRGQPDYTIGLTGHGGGQPDNAHSNDITDTRLAQAAQDQHVTLDFTENMKIDIGGWYKVGIWLLLVENRGKYGCICFAKIFCLGLKISEEC